MHKLILAAIAAPLVLGGMQTSALAACSKTGDGAFSCGTLALSTAAQIKSAVANDAPSAAFALVEGNKNFYLSLFTSIYNANGGVQDTLYLRSIYKQYSASVSSSDVSDLSAFGSFQGSVFGKLANGVVEFFAYGLNVNGNVSYTTEDGYVSSSSPGYLNQRVSLGTAQFQAVPGPEAGAGLGALALGGMALYMKRRRREEATAA